MKFFFLLFLLITVTGNSFAQLRKLQFEDAEEQYTAGRFKETLELPDVSEKTAGKSNPLIEHPRILTLTELLKQDLNGYIDQLENTQTAAKTFLNKYAGDTRLEDKYREVYQASKTLASFPSKAEKAEREKIEKEKKIFADISFLPGYEDGMTAEELKAKVKGFQSEIAQDAVRMLAFLSDKVTSVMISPKSKRSYGYIITVDNTLNDWGFTEPRARFESRIAEMIVKLGAQPMRNKPLLPVTTESLQNGVIIKTIINTETCTWQRETTSITLLFYGVSSEKYTGGSILLTSINSAFK